MLSKRQRTKIETIKNAILKPNVKINFLGNLITKNWEFDFNMSSRKNIDVHIDKFAPEITREQPYIPIFLSSNVEFLIHQMPAIEYLHTTDKSKRQALSRNLPKMPSNYWNDWLIVVDYEKSNFETNEIVLIDSMLIPSTILTYTQYKLEISIDKMMALREQVPNTTVTIDDVDYPQSPMIRPFHEYQRHAMATKNQNQLFSTAISKLMTLIAYNEDFKLLDILHQFKDYIYMHYTLVFKDSISVLRPFSEYIPNYKPVNPQLKTMIEDLIDIENINFNTYHNARIFTYYGSGSPEETSYDSVLDNLFKLPSKFKSVTTFTDDYYATSSVFNDNNNSNTLDDLDMLREDTDINLVLQHVFKHIINTSESDMYQFFEKYHKPATSATRHRLRDEYATQAILNSQTFIDEPNTIAEPMYENDELFDEETMIFPHADIKHTQTNNSTMLMTKLAPRNPLGQKDLLITDDGIYYIAQNSNQFELGQFNIQ